MNHEQFAIMTKNALKILEPEILVSKDALRLLIAIAKQESNIQYRYQVIYKNGVKAAGPARGYFQFEQIGVKGVFAHPASSSLVKKVCSVLDFDHEPMAIWRGIEGNNELAVCIARLLLRTDPAPLATSQKEGWDYYIRNWRPGKPHPSKWAECWKVGEELSDKFY